MKKISYYLSILIFVLCFCLSSCNKEKEPEQKQEIYKNCIWYIDNDIYYQEKMLFDKEVTNPSLPDYVDSTSAKWIGGTFYDEIIDGVYQYSYFLTYKVKEFKVSFYDQNQNLITSQTVKYGENAVAPTYDSNYSVSWDKDFKNVTSNLDIYGTIIKTTSKIKYYDGTSLLKEETYTPGIEYELYKPIKAGYFFVGWYLSDNSLYRIDEISSEEDSDLELYARFNRLDFSDISLPEATDEIVSIKQNGVYFQPQLPSVAQAGPTNYNWTTSDSSIAEVSSYSSLRGGKQGVCVLTATLKSNPNITYNCLIEYTGTGFKKVSLDDLKTRNIYTVTFKGKNGEILDEQKVVEGYTAIYPNLKPYDGFKFTGWDQDVVNITKNMTISATYASGTNEFEGKTISIIGDSISTYKPFMDPSGSVFYPYYAADVRDVNQTWWKIVSNQLGSSIFSNNSSGGSCVYGNTISSTQNIKRIEKTFYNEERPDYIFIYMGSNDAHAKYANEQFKDAYQKMITNIKTLSPNSKIYVITLVESKLYDNDVRLDYNNIIRNIANENELELIDIDNISIENYLIDSAHPNSEGMKVIANEILSKLNK